MTQDPERKIITQHVFPPLPIRAFDWCAYYDDSEESGPYGHGRTEDEAIEDLKDNS